jgi:hypothetical protein
MGTCALKDWGITGSRGDAYAAERVAEKYQGKPVVRMWRSAEGTDGFGAMYQLFRPDRYLGKRVRLSAALRTAGVTGRAALCLRIDGPGDSASDRSLAFDNMWARPPITGTTDWAEHACVVDVPPEATAVFISNILHGPGELFWADVRFEIVDHTVPTTDTMPYELPDEPQNLDFSATR